ncbi:MAG: hypothetical protein AAGC77_12665 [Pseudomonadota bacterium]
MAEKGTAAEQKFFRDMDKKAALSEAEKLRKATLKKTAKLRAARSGIQFCTMRDLLVRMIHLERGSYR